MPIYAYKCTDCNHEFELRQRMSDSPVTDCPVCAGNVRRVVNNVGIVFKGSGFYVTDNRNGKSANGSSKPSSTPAKSDSADAGDTASSSSESKAESPKKEPAKTKSEA